MGKTVLVTGATAGFGRAFTERFVRDGHRVIATGRRRDRLDALARKLGKAVLPLGLDVTDAQAVAGLPEHLPEEWREVDVLINNAGLALGLGPAQEASLADWETMIATNISGLVRLTRAFLPQMVARGAGDIVNLGSTAGTHPYPGGNVYGASKAFVLMFSRNLRADLVGTGVRVVTIEPGLVGGSEFSEIRFKGDKERAEKMYAGANPLMPDDIAEAVAWAVGLPAHVNINRIELMPTSQAAGPLAVKRDAAG
jgi:3-hydroxy acid dehydrogenase/malonic semialdehyde reductase